MFIAKDIVRMHDTDMAGILYFPRQFRFIHDAFEDFLAKEGFGFEKLFNEHAFTFVVVHAESDYLAPLKVGDPLTVHLFTENIGETSFTIGHEIYKEEKKLVGTGKTVHVTLDGKSRKKITVPDEWRNVLKKYYKETGTP